MKLLFTGKDVVDRAEMLLQMNPDPIPKYVLLKEILRVDPHSSELKKAYSEVKTTKWYRQIEANQLPDGSWGQFHSTSIYKDGRGFATQTYARLMVYIGLDKSDSCVLKAIEHMEFLLQDMLSYPDRPECPRGMEQDWYKIAVPMAIPPFLIQLDPDNRLAGKFSKKLAKLVELYYTAESDPKRDDRFYELRKKLYGLDSWIRRGKEKPNLGTYRFCYPLSSKFVKLPAAILHKHLTYMLQTQGALYYCYGRWKMGELVKITDWRFPQWLLGLHQLSSIPEWHRFRAPFYNSIWKQADDNGLWTLSNQKKNKWTLLSSSWRTRKAVTIDHSTAILRILIR